MPDDDPGVMWTIGHSTRSADEFLAVLMAYEIELVVDVRRFPGSRRLPQFDSATLADSLASRGIAYRWLVELGGRRKPDPASRNVAWTHPAFRAYADHVDTTEFASGLFELLMLAGGLRTVIMCAEVLWWRCHRRIIADVLTSIGIDVVDIETSTRATLHRLAPPARLVAGQLSYRIPNDA
ncbi:MAG: DUF488 domain-containing protein [Gemmatimonadaceae bacterium]